MQIFDDRERTDASPRQYAEPLASFLNRIDRPAFQKVRDVLELWFARYCPSGQADLRGRLRSRDDRQVYGAFWELYLHETLRASGYGVSCHPLLQATSRRPDFRATLGDDALVLEARLAWLAEEERATDGRINRLYDAINRIASPNFFLDVGVDAAGSNEPTDLRPMRREVESWLASLDPDEVERHLQTNGIDQLPGREWSNGGWRLTLRAIPISRAHRGASDLRTIGMSTRPSGRIQGIAALRNALSDKANAYGSLDEPLIIAVRTDWRTDRGDMVSALYGTGQIAYTQGAGPDNQVWHVRKNDGLWSEGRHSGVSGVLVSSEIVPWTVTSNIPVLWENPNATHPVSAVAVWERAVVEGDEIRYISPLLPMRELLDLPEIWPPGMLPD